MKRHKGSAVGWQRRGLQQCTHKPRIACRLEAERGARKQILLWSLQREHRPSNTMISEFQSPEAGNNTFLLFSATWIQVFHDGSSRKPTDYSRAQQRCLCLSREGRTRSGKNSLKDRWSLRSEECTESEQIWNWRSSAISRQEPAWSEKLRKQDVWCILMGRGGCERCSENVGSVGQKQAR